MGVETVTPGIYGRRDVPYIDVCGSGFNVGPVLYGPLQRR